MSRFATNLGEEVYRLGDTFSFFADIARDENAAVTSFDGIFALLLPLAGTSLSFKLALFIKAIFVRIKRSSVSVRGHKPSSSWKLATKRYPAWVFCLFRPCAERDG